jgi:hypothetical protein
VNELEDADLSHEQSPEGDVILLCDPSTEGETVMAALRGVGFAVVTAQLAVLEVRLIEESPRVLIVNIDQPAAVETIERARELAAGAAVTLVCVGDPDRADDLRGVGSGVRCFPRPVDLGHLIAHVTEFADPTRKSRHTQESFPPSVRSFREDTAPPPTHDSESPEPSELPSNPDPFDIASILPSSLDAMVAAPALSTQLSPELEQLMLSAERRVGSQAHLSSLPPPDEDDLLLSPDLLLALDEPLESDDDGITGPELTTRSLANARLLGKRPGSHPGSNTGVRSPYDHTGDSAPGTPAETDPMQPRAGRSFPPPASAGVGSRRGRTLAQADDAPIEPAPVSRDTITPVERRAAPSTRSVRPPPPPPVPSLPMQPAQHDFAASPTSRAPASTPAPSFGPHTAPPPPIGRAPVFSSPPAPLSIMPGSTYSTRSVVSRGLTSAETSRPAATVAAMTEPMRRPPPMTTAPAPMPASVRSAPSRRAPAYVSTSRAASLPPGPPSSRAARPPPPSVKAPQPQRASIPPRSAGQAPPRSTRAPQPALPPALGDGDAALVLATVIAARATGSLALTTETGLRRIVLQDGDIMTAASWVESETLLAFLTARGDIDRDVAARFEGKLPPFGRHAGAALIAHGHLGQDDLWPVLRAHAEWIIGHAVLARSGTCELEPEPPGRLKAEPNVFGGATGAEVFIETVRRVIPAEAAARRAGGSGARLNIGPHAALLGECALRRDEEDVIRSAKGKSVAEILEATDGEFVTVVYALSCLGVIELLAAPSPPKSEQAPRSIDPLDEEAVRQRVRARLALVEDGDYFSLLGVEKTATSYEIRRAYVELRRGFEPSRLLTAATADLGRDVRLIIEVLDEAYEILREPHRRERYRKAIDSAGPP